MKATATSSYAWALHELGFADFNDERLTKRGISIATKLLENPQSSIPKASSNWASTKATYRFFDNKKVQGEDMLSSSIGQTIKRVGAEETVLVAQDSTTINLSNKEVSGLGRIGMGDLQGFFTHSALAMNTKGFPLGLLYQKTYIRKTITRNKEYKKNYKKLPIEDKETGKWVEVIKSVKERLKNKRIVIIGDRESDIYDVFKAGKESGVDLLVRTSQNRLITNGTNEEKIYLFDLSKQANILTRYSTDIPTTVNSHKTRRANFEIRISAFEMLPSKNRIRKEELPIKMFLLDVMEINPPDNEKAVHWMLTTTMEIKTDRDAIEKIEWYMYRWRIERFHYILKTGAFNVEKLQFETFERFKKAMSMFSIVAYRILNVSK